MPIEKDLRARLSAAMKAKDLTTANVIRMINTKVMERRTAKGFAGEVDDALYTDVIAAYRKTLGKARDEYAALGDQGRAHIQELDFEIDFCAQFLPQALGEAEVRAAVKDAIAETGATDVKMAGRVVGAVLKKHKGTADAALVKKLVDEALALGRG